MNKGTYFYESVSIDKRILTELQKLIVCVHQVNPFQLNCRRALKSCISFIPIGIQRHLKVKYVSFRNDNELNLLFYIIRLQFFTHFCVCMQVYLGSALKGDKIYQPCQGYYLCGGDTPWLQINRWYGWRWNPVWVKLEEEIIWLSQVRRGTVTDNYAPQLCVLVGFVACAGKWN